MTPDFKDEKLPTSDPVDEAASSEPREADLFDDKDDLVSLDDLPEDPDEVIGEDDDNPYEEPDEALPDDQEERSISRDISREGSRFGEV